MKRKLFVTKKDIVALAKKYIHADKLNMLLVGDKAKILPGLEKLGYPIVELDADGKPAEKKRFDLYIKGTSRRGSGRFLILPQKQSSQRAKTNYYNMNTLPRNGMKTGTSSHKAKFILVLDNGLFSNAACLKIFQIKLKSGPSAA